MLQKSRGVFCLRSPKGHSQLRHRRTGLRDPETEKQCQYQINTTLHTFEQKIDKKSMQIRQNSTEIYDLLKKSVMIRIPKMPMNSMIEVEMICDSIHVEDEDDKNYMVDLVS